MLKYWSLINLYKKSVFFIQVNIFFKWHQIQSIVSKIYLNYLNVTINNMTLYQNLLIEFIVKSKGEWINKTGERNIYTFNIFVNKQ